MTAEITATVETGAVGLVKRARPLCFAELPDICREVFGYVRQVGWYAQLPGTSVPLPDRVSQTHVW